MSNIWVEYEKEKQRLRVERDKLVGNCRCKDCEDFHSEKCVDRLFFDRKPDPMGSPCAYFKNRVIRSTPTDTIIQALKNTNRKEFEDEQ